MDIKRSSCNYEVRCTTLRYSSLNMEVVTRALLFDNTTNKQTHNNNNIIKTYPAFICYKIVPLPTLYLNINQKNDLRFINKSSYIIYIYKIKKSKKLERL